MNELASAWTLLRLALVLAGSLAAQDPYRGVGLTVHLNSELGWLQVTGSDLTWSAGGSVRATLRLPFDTSLCAEAVGDTCLVSGASGPTGSVVLRLAATRSGLSVTSETRFPSHKVACMRFDAIGRDLFLVDEATDNIYCVSPDGALDLAGVRPIATVRRASWTARISSTQSGLFVGQWPGTVTHIYRSGAGGWVRQETVTPRTSTPFCHLSRTPTPEGPIEIEVRGPADLTLEDSTGGVTLLARAAMGRVSLNLPPGARMDPLREYRLLAASSGEPASTDWFLALRRVGSSRSSGRLTLSGELQPGARHAYPGSSFFVCNQRLRVSRDGPEVEAYALWKLEPAEAPVPVRVVGGVAWLNDPEGATMSVPGTAGEHPFAAPVLLPTSHDIVGKYVYVQLCARSAGGVAVSEVVGCPVTRAARTRVNLERHDSILRGLTSRNAVSPGDLQRVLRDIQTRL